MREPYVKVGDYVQWLGDPRHWFWCDHSFIKAKQVRVFDDQDFLVNLVRVTKDPDIDNTYWFLDRWLYTQRDISPQFWWNKDIEKLYPNVQTYLRTVRFGETGPEAIKVLNYTSINPDDWDTAITSGQDK